MESLFGLPAGGSLFGPMFGPPKPLTMMDIYMGLGMTRDAALAALTIDLPVTVAPHTREFPES